MKPKTDNLMSLLPEGIDDSIATEIANITNAIIQEQVEARMKVLESKITGFLRANVEQIKEHALKELVQENPDFRDAMLFREMKSLFVLDMDDESQSVAVKKVSKESDELREEVDTLTEEIVTIASERDKFRTTAIALSGKINKLNNELVDLKEHLIEVKDKPFRSSEKAKVVTRVDENKKQKVSEKKLNEELQGLLSPQSMALMPKNRK